MRSAMIVVVLPARQGRGALRVAGELFADQSLFPMGAVETLETAIRLWMRNPRPDIAGAGERDERPPFAADKLAAPIVDELRFARTTARKRVERFLHGQHDEIGLHRHVQLPMHEIPAVSVQDVHEVVPAWP